MTPELRNHDTRSGKSPRQPKRPILVGVERLPDQPGVWEVSAACDDEMTTGTLVVEGLPLPFPETADELVSSPIAELMVQRHLLECQSCVPQEPAPC